MGFLDNIKKWTNERITDAKKLKNTGFLEAVTAGCAMVAAADGVIDSQEKAKMVGFIQRNETLKVFDTDDVVKYFNKFANGFDFDIVIGRGEALKAVAKVKNDVDNAKLLVRVCCAIGAADGDFDNDEKNVVVAICDELGLEPREFGLGESTKDNPKSASNGMPDWMR